MAGPQGQQHTSQEGVLGPQQAIHAYSCWWEFLATPEVLHSCFRWRWRPTHVLSGCTLLVINQHPGGTVIKQATWGVVF